MSRWLWATVLVLGVAAQGNVSAAAQEPQVRIVVPDSGVVQELRLVDGTVYYGRVVVTGDPVRFMLTTGDVIEIRRDRIATLRAVEARVVEGRVWPPDPNATRLFFAPTARSLHGGDGYFAMYEIFMPFLAVGLGERVTVRRSASCTVWERSGGRGTSR